MGWNNLQDSTEAAAEIPWPLSLVSREPVHLQAGLSKDAAEIVSKMQAWDIMRCILEA